MRVTQRLRTATVDSGFIYVLNLPDSRHDYASYIFMSHYANFYPLLLLSHLWKHTSVTAA